jgi:hypothetical protein
MKKLMPVKDHPNLLRDMSSGAIINNDKEEMNRALQRRKSRSNKKREEEKLKGDVEHLKNEIAEIKNLLSNIAEKL